MIPVRLLQDPKSAIVGVEDQELAICRDDPVPERGNDEHEGFRPAYGE